MPGQPIKDLLKKLRVVGHDIAYIMDKGTLYYTVYPGQGTGKEEQEDAKGQSPYSAGVILMQKLSEGRFKLRIDGEKADLCTSESGRMARGMGALLGVAVHDLEYNEHLEYFDLKEVAPDGWEARKELELFEHHDVPMHTAYGGSEGERREMPLDLNQDVVNGCKMRPVHRLYMMAAYSIALNRAVVANVTSGHPIACILADAKGKILGWGINTNAYNKSLHAEVNMLQAYYKRTKSALPAGCVIYTTLKPCKMCAAMIEQMGLQHGSLALKVYIGQDDPGHLAKDTALDAAKYKGVPTILGKTPDGKGGLTGFNAIKIPPAPPPPTKGPARLATSAAPKKEDYRELGKTLNTKYNREQGKDVSEKYPITSFLGEQAEKGGLLPQAQEAFFKKIDQYRKGEKQGDPMADDYTKNRNVWIALKQITQYLVKLKIPGVVVVKTPPKPKEEKE